MSIGTFFDIDGTLVPPPSLERRLLRWLLWRREVSPASLVRWLASAAWRLRRGANCAFGANKSYLAGVRWTAIEGWFLMLRRFPIGIFPEAMARLRWHALHGHRVFLVSGTLAPLAHALAEQLPVGTETCATEVELFRGRLTGRVAGPHGHVSGPAKAAAIAALARRQHLRLEDSFAYGNSSADRWMLEAVGNPVAVNPSRRLAGLAQRRGWPVVTWRGSGGVAAVPCPSSQEEKCLPST
jgi:HAD superfamily hydrolase (TIGR01490 family)